jgi:biopolymer transport protein TolR
MKKRRAIKAELNIVPYVDVMLVLLVIFMAATPAMQSSTNVSLPDTVHHLETHQQTLTLLPDGQWQLDDQPPQPSVIILHKLTPLSTIALKGNPTLPYQTVTHALQTLQQAGIDHVSLAL